MLGASNPAEVPKRNAERRDFRMKTPPFAPWINDGLFSMPVISSPGRRTHGQRRTGTVLSEEVAMRISRRRVLAGTVAATGAVALRFPAGAAEFSYRMATEFAANH